MVGGGARGAKAAAAGWSSMRACSCACGSGGSPRSARPCAAGSAGGAASAAHSHQRAGSTAQAFCARREAAGSRYLREGRGVSD
jgi:hypothetical protein